MNSMFNMMFTTTLFYLTNIPIWILQWFCDKSGLFEYYAFIEAPFFFFGIEFEFYCDSSSESKMGRKMKVALVF